MRILACGFNGHGQLSEQMKPNDLYGYQEIASGDSVEVVFACWSQTVVRVDGSVRILGHDNASNVETPEVPLHSFFGDHNGLCGAVGANHRLYLFKSEPDHWESNFIQWYKPSQSPDISHVAMASNGTIALATTPTPTSPGFNVHTFPSLSAFLNFFRHYSSYKDPSPSRTHHIPSPSSSSSSSSQQCLQLVAGATTFTLLTPTSVYTWTTDARHARFLGRTPTPTTPHDEPHPLPALEGLFIAKIASRGWLSAALSKHGAVYTWPQSRPDESREVPEEDWDEEVHLQDLEGDVVDVGVGAGHVFVVMGGGRVMGIGDEGFGRLGGGGEESGGVRREWVEIGDLREGGVSGVVCGDLATFLTMKE